MSPMPSSLLIVEEVADLLKISPMPVYQALFQALSERQDMALDLPEQLCECEKRQFAIQTQAAHPTVP